MPEERKGWCSRREALGRSLGTRLKHSSRKSRASGLRWSGRGGGAFELAMWNIADICSGRCQSSGRREGVVKEHVVRVVATGRIGLAAMQVGVSVVRCDGQGAYRDREVLAPRRLPGGHLDHGAAHRPDVGLPAVPGLGDDLRRHPVGGALDGLEAGVHSHQVLDLLGGAEVRELHHARVVHQDVGALDVAVHDLVGVQELQPQQDLLGVHADDALREAAKLGQQGRDGASGDKLQEDVEGHVGEAALGAEVAHDVGVVQLLQHVHLRLQVAHVLRDLALHVHVLGDGHLLHRHQLPRVQVEPEVHPAKGARADELALLPPDLLLVRQRVHLLLLRLLGAPAAIVAGLPVHRPPVPHLVAQVVHHQRLQLATGACLVKGALAALPAAPNHLLLWRLRALGGGRRRGGGGGGEPARCLVLLLGAAQLEHAAAAALVRPRRRAQVAHPDRPTGARRTAAAPPGCRHRRPTAVAQRDRRQPWHRQARTLAYLACWLACRGKLSARCWHGSP
mmetsp:Transcript_44695/g.113111  ORF Transcript_44695/g.113111 Transcript_44695/m.113111 type:complete len:508 (+) Transcript_44695:335-1858(+)